MTAGYYRHDVGSRMSFTGAVHLFAAMTRRAAAVWRSTIRTAGRATRSASLPSWAATTLHVLALTGLYMWAVLASGLIWAIALTGGLMIMVMVPMWYFVIFVMFGPFVIPYRLHARHQRRTSAQQQQMINAMKEARRD